MRTGRPKQPLTLAEEERDRLQSLAHRARSQSLLARQARVVLACAEGCDNKTVAKKLRCSTGDGRQVARAVSASSAGRALR
jgi:DNA-binding NarL/FixJ family response regulator